MHNHVWIRHAQQLAVKAQQAGEVPVGAVLVRDDEVLGEGWNASVGEHDPCAHAEIMALRAAGKKVGNYRLPESTLYITLEPCLMCAGAILHARVGRVVFGAYDPKTGAAGSVFDLLQDERHYHRPQVVGGVLEEECAAQLRAFFRERRQSGKRKLKRDGSIVDEPVVAGKAPKVMELEAGTYYWCTCGRSQNQPFCDGSHKGTSFSPQAFAIEETRKCGLCTCKHTKNGPFCDGSHRDL